MNWLVACNRCEQIEEDIKKLEVNLPLGLLYKVTDNQKKEKDDEDE